MELEVIIRTNREAGLERRDGALAGVAQWNVHWPANQRVVGLILSQGTCLGCGPGPQLGVCETQPTEVSLTLRCFSPSFSPSPPSLKLVNKIFFKKRTHF